MRQYAVARNRWHVPTPGVKAPPTLHRTHSVSENYLQSLSCHARCKTWRPTTSSWAQRGAHMSMRRNSSDARCWRPQRRYTEIISLQQASSGESGALPPWLEATVAACWRTLSRVGSCQDGRDSKLVLREWDWCSRVSVLPGRSTERTDMEDVISSTPLSGPEPGRKLAPLDWELPTAPCRLGNPCPCTCACDSEGDSVKILKGPMESAVADRIPILV